MSATKCAAKEEARLSACAPTRPLHPPPSLLTPAARDQPPRWLTPTSSRGGWGVRQRAAAQVRGQRRSRARAAFRGLTILGRVFCCRRPAGRPRRVCVGTLSTGALYTRAREGGAERFSVRVRPPSETQKLRAKSVLGSPSPLHSASQPTLLPLAPCVRAPPTPRVCGAAAPDPFSTACVYPTLFLRCFQLFILKPRAPLWCPTPRPAPTRPPAPPPFQTRPP